MFIKLASTNKRIKKYVAWLSTIFKVRALLSAPNPDYQFVCAKWFGIRVAIVKMYGDSELHYVRARRIARMGGPYLKEIQLTPNQSFERFRVLYFCSFGVIDYFEHFSPAQGLNFPGIRLISRPVTRY